MGSKMAVYFRGWTNQIRRYGVRSRKNDSWLLCDLSWGSSPTGCRIPIPWRHSHHLPFLGSSRSQTHFAGPSSIRPMRLMVFFRTPPFSVRLTTFPDVCVAECVLGLRVLSWFCSRHAPVRWSTTSLVSMPFGVASSFSERGSARGSGLARHATTCHKPVAVSTGASAPCPWEIVLPFLHWCSTSCLSLPTR